MVQGNPTVKERSLSVKFQTSSGRRAVCRRTTPSSGRGCCRGDREVEAAIAALGDSTAHANPFKEALRVAQARVSVRPVEERVESCKLFLERARKRVERAQAVVDRASEQKVLYEAAVAEDEARCAKILAEAATVDATPVVSPQVTKLQEWINALVLERDALRAAPVVQGIPKEAQGTWTGDLLRVEDIPPMPTSDWQDLAGWMSQRNCELRNAMVRESSSRGQDWQFGGTRGKFVLHDGSRRVNGGRTGRR